MSSPYDQQIEDLLEQYRRQRAEAVETRQRINGTTSTATAPRQAVKITVGAQGEVTAIEFPTGAYRRMAPKELADVLLTTIRQARSEALEGVAAVLAEGLPPGVTVPDLLQGRVDPGTVLPEDPAMPDSVREYVDHGFQGDPHE
ncbi:MULTISPECIES: YbaB/EbfC family nucleoid-associated protein [unclassified Streptomyces]|uniref:YbaB/EbfC family nucleoid-associated protein n=1 Tax=unclassified Streptomyces TaxID=2593676 RepID=UPI00227204E7|nr:MULTISPECIES: YbaB/EbfC family nucleoid-associated protein [unclassified Streptomyces]MCY0960245.1 YbaB/EbfC family nucleoid-associated protein [Streptomyces sp. H27-H5]